MKTAQVFIDYDGVIHHFDYTSDAEVINTVWELLRENYTEPGADEDVFVTLPDGRRFTWLPAIAHYCFAKGRITQQEAFEMMLNEEKKGDTK
ncbi:hypothetical protein LJC11_05695 [Bacteroidales bacterium OttesenSCG-928-I21]|nr:hypothetical protein [Bacteroidales bacterium OttesenSCG-928-I21]